MEDDSRVAMVTGASGGIGKATAVALADDGFHVVLVSRREKELTEIAADIEAIDGLATPYPADLVADDQISRLVDDVFDQFEEIDVLVNCAGTVYREPIVSAERDEWQQELLINLLGVMNMSQIVLQRMLDNGGGHIVNVSSLNARKPAPGASGYSASKAGVNNFSESLRQEVTADGVRITVIEPGAVNTDMQPDEVKEALQILEPEDVANVIVYAVSQPKHVSVNNVQIRPTEQEF